MKTGNPPLSRRRLFKKGAAAAAGAALASQSATSFGQAPGIVTATGPRAGEVVQAGQMIVKLARHDGRDAVFDVPARVIRSAPANPEIVASLTSDPAVTAVGRVREVAPQANPVTRTFEVKVGLTDPPAAMRLGATVAGRLQVDAEAVIEVYHRVPERVPCEQARLGFAVAAHRAVILEVVA